MGIWKLLGRLLSDMGHQALSRELMITEVTERSQAPMELQLIEANSIVWVRPTKGAQGEITL